MDIVLGGAVLLLVALVAPLMGNYYLYVVSLVAIYTLACASITLLLGAAGQVSMGHAAFLAAGAYAGLFALRRVTNDLLAEIVLAAVVAGLVGLVIGLPSLRLGDLYLAVGTLALGFAAQQLFFIWKDVTGGGAGVSVPPATLLSTDLSQPRPFLYVCLVVTGVGLLLERNLLHGRTGRAFIALRTSPSAALSSGVPIGAHKLAAFGISAALTGVAGVLYAHAISYISPEDFNVDLSILLLVVPIIGGLSSLWGAFIGAAFVVGLPELLRFARELQFLIYGGLLLLAMLFMREGLFGSAWRALRVRQTRHASVSAQPANGHIPIFAASLREPRLADGASGGAQLVVRDLSVVFGGLRAVDRVSFSLEQGSIVGLVGPNGAGKTTVFNAISGYVRPSEGAIFVDNQRIDRLSAGRRVRLGVARTFQHVNLFKGLSVLDHLLIGQHSLGGYGPLSQVLRLPAYARGESVLVERAWDVMRALGLEAYAAQVASDLPYGLQKRVDVARALAARPQLLLLDEPAAGLLPAEADALLDAVIAVCGLRQTSVVVVEHNIELVLRVSQRVLALDSGRIIADGVPALVRDDRAFVESYLGV